MNYKIKASDLPPSEIPEGWKPYQPGTSYHMGDKIAFTLGDALIQTREIWENMMLEQREAITHLVQNEKLAKQLLEAERSTAIPQIRKILEERSKLEDWQKKLQERTMHSPYGLSRSELRLRVIDDLQGVDPDPNTELKKVTLPEDTLMDTWNKLAITATVSLHPGLEDEAVYILYHPDYEQISLQGYNALVGMINNVKPIEPING